MNGRDTMFIDEVIIELNAGRGGNGCMAFRREKYIPMGGPFGGNGGKGADIIFKVDEGLHTLLDLRYQKTIKGLKGENGKGKNQHGKGAQALVVKVPQGTVVTDLDTGLIIADLSKKDQEEVIAKGGRGGRGNSAFKTQTNTCPDYSENGEEGEIKNLKASYEDIKERSNNPFEELINKTKETLKSLKERLIEFNKNTMHLEILRDACSENGVKRFIIKDIIKLLNSLIQKYLNEIGCDFLVYFDEAMDFTFLTQSGECEFSNFSAGEKQRIQISTMLAFRDLILNGKLHSNIFIIDEMLDMNVDSICIENVMKILKRKSIESNQNIFIVSHRSELAEDETIWNNIIKITKEHGQSSYSVK